MFLCDVCQKPCPWEDGRFCVVQGASKWALAALCSKTCAQEAMRRWPLTQDERARLDWERFARQHPGVAALVSLLPELEETT
jgi:hypothetical protein